MIAEVEVEEGVAAAGTETAGETLDSTHKTIISDLELLLLVHLLLLRTMCSPVPSSAAL